jgi:hypothetical protein
MASIDERIKEPVTSRDQTFLCAGGMLFAALTMEKL